jgi:hypothetical protein
MCSFVETPNVMPGWGCCRCHVYNGLQRPACKECRKERHPIEVPAGVKFCSKCGWGYRGEFKDYGHTSCPCCAVIEREVAALN